MKSKVLGMLLRTQNSLQQLPEHAPHPLRALPYTRKNNSRANRKSHRLSPLLPLLILPGTQRRERTRRNKQREVRAPTRLLHKYRPATQGAARADAIPAVDVLVGLGRSAEDFGPDTRAHQADAVVVQGDESAEESGGADGGEKCFEEASSAGLNNGDGEVEWEVGREGPDEGSVEAGKGVILAIGAGAQMDDLAGEGDRGMWIAVGEWPVVICAHFLQDVSLAGVNAILNGVVARSAQGEEEAVVYTCGRTDPGVVGAGEFGRRVDPAPHYYGARGREDGWVCHVRDCSLGLQVLVNEVMS